MMAYMKIPLRNVKPDLTENERKTIYIIIILVLKLTLRGFPSSIKDFFSRIYFFVHFHLIQNLLTQC